MADTQWPTVATDDAAPLLKRADLDDEGAALCKPGMKPREFVRALREAGRGADAIKTLAQALPAREAVWWACRCIRALPLTDPKSPAARALGLAEQWAIEPSEERARQAYALAQELEFKNPHAWAATATLWAGPNMNPIPDLPPIEPDPSLAGKAVSGAICLAAVVDNPPKPAERHRQFLELGEAVASGKDSWKQHVG